MSTPDTAKLVIQRLTQAEDTALITPLQSAIRGAPKGSLCVLTVAIICALFAPFLAPADPIQTNRANILTPPSLSRHLLGPDHLGRDTLSRLIYGARISVPVGFLAVFVSGTVGTVIAMVSGVLRGWVDVVLMRLTDTFLALPYLVVAVTVVAILGSSLANVILVIGLLRWMTYARTIRGEVLRLAEMDFVRLARVAGISRFRIIRRHIFPNIVNTLLVLGTLEVGSAAITEASLSFLGLGIPRPLPSWGAMLAESQTYVFGLVAAGVSRHRYHPLSDGQQFHRRLAARSLRSNEASTLIRAFPGMASSLRSAPWPQVSWRELHAGARDAC